MWLIVRDASGVMRPIELIGEFQPQHLPDQLLMEIAAAMRQGTVVGNEAPKEPEAMVKSLETNLERVKTLFKDCNRDQSAVRWYLLQPFNRQVLRSLMERDIPIPVTFKPGRNSLTRK